MTYRIEFEPKAERWLTKQPADVRRRVGEKIAALAKNPRPNGVAKLQGQSQLFYRIRVGDYRVVYTIEDDRLIILVVAVGNRRDIYRGY